MKSNRLVNLNSLQIPVYDNDPPSGSLTSPGLMWFNQTSGSIKFTYNTSGSGNVWSAGGSLIYARSLVGGAGTQNEGLIFGGLSTPTIVSCTEKYNGSSWSTTSALITVRCSHAGAGTQNEALAFGGASPALVTCTEEFVGPSYCIKTANFT